MESQEILFAKKTENSLKGLNDRCLREYQRAKLSLQNPASANALHMKKPNKNR